MNVSLDKIKSLNGKNKERSKNGNAVGYQLFSITSDGMANVTYTVYLSGEKVISGVLTARLANILLGDIPNGEPMSLYSCKLRHKDVLPVFITNFSAITQKDFELCMKNASVGYKPRLINA